MSSWNERRKIFESEAHHYAKEIRVDDFEHASYCSFHKKYFYGESPKTGCSTIKKVLIQAELGRRIDFEHLDYIHYREFNPFLKISQVGALKTFFERSDIFKFCFARNPYARLLSCYLDKIEKDKYQNQAIKIQLGRSVDDDRVVTFEEFVHLVVKQPIMYMDPHWRTQYYQTFQQNITYDFIGRFERINRDLEKVLEHLEINGQMFNLNEQSHATQADQKISEFYNDELAKLVYQKYQIDFEFFNYDASLPKS